MGRLILYVDLTMVASSYNQTAHVDRLVRSDNKA